MPTKTARPIVPSTNDIHHTGAYLTTEFDRQVPQLVRIGYPKLIGMSRAKFTAALEPLRYQLPSVKLPPGRIPFVIVVPAVPIDAVISMIEQNGKRAFTTMEPDDIARFQPTDGVGIPDAVVYLISDIDTGKANLNVTPDDAVSSIRKSRRLSLTLAEGFALLTHYPGILKTHNAFSMLASRCGDRRVTALWLSRGAPRLGWCWAGNPHTWLAASCACRLGTSPASQHLSPRTPHFVDDPTPGAD